MYVSVVYFFLLSYSITLYDYITFYLPIHSLVDFRVFPFPTIINSSATHIHVQVFVSIYVLFLLGMSGISGSYGEFIFNFSRNSQTVFQNSCTILYCFHILPSTGLCLFVCCLFPLFLISFFLPSHWLLIHFLRIPFWFISRMSIWAHTQKQYLGAYFYVYLFLVVALRIIYLYNLSSSTFLQFQWIEETLFSFILSYWW